jgi:hypothetical protein
MNQRNQIDRLLQVSRPVEWVVCSECSATHPVEPSHSPGIERETKCARCYNAEVAKLTRELQEVNNTTDLIAKIRIPRIALSQIRIELELFKVRKLLQAALNGKSYDVHYGPREEERDSQRDKQATTAPVRNEAPTQGPRLGEEETARAIGILEAEGGICASPASD